jgi:hypothetical protein
LSCLSAPHPSTGDLPRAGAALSMKARFRGPFVAQTSIGRLAQPCGAKVRRSRKEPANEAVRSGSSPSVVVPDSACHAGGRGFESRRPRVFSTNYLQIGTLCCPPRRKRGPAFLSSRVYPARDFPGNPRRKRRAPGNPRKPDDRPTWPEVCSRSSKKDPVCRDFVTADNGSSPHPARIPRVVLCSTNARPSPGSRTASPDAHEPIRSRRTFPSSGKRP